MTSTIEQTSPSTAANDKGYALAVYVLYILGFFTGITALVGVIIASVKTSSTKGLMQSHFRFQVYTFWIGLLYFVAGSILLFFYVGAAIWLWWTVWTLIRVIKGLILLNDGKPIAAPTSWLFG
jgi:uncharacterized membrane protein